MSPDEYKAALDNAVKYAGRAEGQQWNDLFLAGLYRNGLMLTNVEAWRLIYEFIYYAPRPYVNSDNKHIDNDLWPHATWIIPRGEME